jgi:pimeloyl-ACP methyl ester carboxylesterase
MESATLLLVHGYPFDHTLWDKVRPLLNSKVQVIAPDLRGFNGQPTGNEEPALEVMADDLAALVKNAGSQRAVVAGMSMGGYIALAFAERHPAMLAGLALVSSQAAADTEEARASRRATIEKVRANGPGVAAEATVPKLFAPKNSGREELKRIPETSAERAGIAGITWALEAMARRSDRTAILQSLAVPVSIIHGLHDAFIPVERARALAQTTREAEFVQVDGAGHATPLEAPERVAQALDHLIRRSFPGLI